MSNISRTNICWKIRDTETGFFWNGYSHRCNHEIGTRFDRRSALDDTIKHLWRVGGRDPGRGFPLTWEVVEVQLSEAEREIMSGPDAIVDLQIEEHMGNIVTQRFSAGGREVASGWKLFRRLRRQHEFDQWACIGLRNKKFQRWNDVKATMKPLGIDTVARCENNENGWILFKDSEAATMARMADMLKGVGEVEELRVAFAQAIGIPLERI